MKIRNREQTMGREPDRREYQKRHSSRSGSKVHMDQKAQVPALNLNLKKKREESCCPVSERCGGCCFQGVPYPDQLKAKEQYVRKLCGSMAPVNHIAGMEDPLHYRCKVHAVYSRNRHGDVISGIYEGNSHRVVPVTDCRIEDERADAILRTIHELVISFRIRIYDEDTGFGLFRHALIRVGKQTGQILVVLVLAAPMLPSKRNFTSALRRAHPEITSIVLNVNDRDTNMVLGGRNIVLYGPGYIEDRLCGCTFRISPNSFYQVNPVQTEKLYQSALSLAKLSGSERVLDAYCGTGTIGILASVHAGEVIGAELNRDAVRDARENARRNHRSNIRFVEADAADFLEKAAADGERFDVVMMDPPRAGSSKRFLKAVRAAEPRRVIYISCEPLTLARDVREFEALGYRAGKFLPFDCFPYTASIETICLLTRDVRGHGALHRQTQ